MNMHLNYGKGLQRPFESSYSIFRRFLIANPTLSISNMRKFLRQSNEFDYSLLDSVIKRNEIPSKSKRLASLGVKNSNGTLKSIVLHCPVCAQQGYHTDIFRLPWISCCPIHHVPLSDKCPVCNQEWPTLYDIIKRDCPGCGKKLDYKKINKQEKLSDNLMYDPIIHLFDFIYSKNKKNVSSRLKSSLVIYNYRKQWPRYEDTLYPSYQLIRRPIINRRSLSIIGISTEKIYCKKFSIYKPDKPISQLDSNEYLTINQEWIAKERYKALSLIAKCIKAVTPHTHELEVFDFAALSKNAVKEFIPLCPYCVAFSIWFYRVTGAPFRYKYRRSVGNRNPLAELIETQSTINYFKPAPMDKCECGYKIFDTSIEFQKWLYQRDLQSTFIKIFNSAEKLLKGFSNDNTRGNKISEDLSTDFEFHDNLNDNTVLCFSDLNRMEINACYRERALLETSTLPKITGSTRNCMAFKRKIKSYGLRDVLKVYKIAQPINNGLNRDELSILKHGHEEYSHFDEYITRT